MRQAIVWLHRWVGLATLLFIAVAAITGVIIAFDKELDHTLNRDLFYVEAAGQRMAMDELVKRAESVYEGKRVTFVRSPVEADRAYEFYLRTPNAQGAEEASFFKATNKYHTVYINPYTGVVLGARVNGEFGVDRRASHSNVGQTALHLVSGRFRQVADRYRSFAVVARSFWCGVFVFPQSEELEKIFRVSLECGRA